MASDPRRHRHATVEVMMTDITTLDVDVVVNAANENLSHGGGVAAAIASAGGWAIQAESDRWVDEHGPVVGGEAVVTTGGFMPARYVVHVVGPCYSGSPEDEPALRSAVKAALDRAEALGARSVAIPAISAGIYGYPRDESTSAIADEAVGWAGAHSGQVERIVLVGFDKPTADAFSAALASEN